MGNTLTIRLPKELSDWLDDTSRKVGVPRGRLIRMQLELARHVTEEKPFMKYLGALDLAPDSSTRKGFTGQKKPGSGISKKR